MKVAIVGAGFTGLTSALYLSRKGYQVVVFEKETTLGGLVTGFKKNNWQWTIEKHYHHWFTNDRFAFSLIKKLRLKKDLLILSPHTSIFYQNKIYPFSSALDVLTFKPLTLPQRLRTGAVLAFLKFLPASLAISMENTTAYNWLTRAFGQDTFRILWQPLFEGKFGSPPKGFADKVNMTWFWARIKKRTPRLAYLKGGYQHLLKETALQIKKSGGQIKLGNPFTDHYVKKFDKVIFTAPSPVFKKIFPNLPSYYQRKLTLPHLHALNLLLISNQKFLDKTYWLNINDHRFPFIGVIAHTNFINKKYYGGKHLTWVANYLSPGHPFLKKTKHQLLKIYQPYLKKINPSFNFDIGNLDFEVFQGPFAQPVFIKNYSKARPDIKTPIKNVYLANMDMVYPWDRGTNYAIELGQKAAKLVEKES